MESETQTQPSGKDTPLLQQVFQRIAKKSEGSISFSDYLEVVLYDPEWGYYSRPENREIGREGDFYTSVSVGSMFGFLLSERVRREWEDSFAGDRPVLVEMGAHNGQLARDIIDAFRIANTEAIYRIIESREWIATELRKQLESDQYPEIEVVSSFAEASAEEGIFLCNELLDALPFDRLGFVEGAWKEMRVAEEAGTLRWTLGSVRSEHERFVANLGTEFPDGYETEICPALDEWVEGASQLFDRGRWWIIDYGYESEEYFKPSRITGTLRCYRQHHATENPFEFPGEMDITAHVNFSHLREAAEEVGLSWERFTDQHHFLIDAAKDWLLSMEGTPPAGDNAKRLRQFQTLTHPGMMGTNFKVAELSKE